MDEGQWRQLDEFVVRASTENPARLKQLLADRGLGRDREIVTHDDMVAHRDAVIRSDGVGLSRRPGQEVIYGTRTGVVRSTTGPESDAGYRPDSACDRCGGVGCVACSALHIDRHLGIKHTGYVRCEACWIIYDPTVEHLCPTYVHDLSCPKRLSTLNECECRTSYPD